MRAVLQRVRWAEVEADGQVLGHIEQGLVVYLGIALDDRTEDADWLADKIAALRIFEDADGKLNRSVQDVEGAVLAVPNFTLMADARNGRRPAFVDAARPEQAGPLYEAFLAALGKFALPGVRRPHAHPQHRRRAGQHHSGHPPRQVSHPTRGTGRPEGRG